MGTMVSETRLCPIFCNGGTKCCPIYSASEIKECQNEFNDWILVISRRSKRIALNMMEKNQFCKKHISEQNSKCNDSVCRDSLRSNFNRAIYSRLSVHQFKQHSSHFVRSKSKPLVQSVVERVESRIVADNNSRSLAATSPRVGPIRPYRWWKARSLCMENRGWNNDLKAWNLRIRNAEMAEKDWQRQ